MSLENQTGEVPIIIDGKEYVLRPTLAVALEFAKDDLTELVQRCVRLNFSTIQRVIIAGLGRSSRDLPALIYKTGLRNVNGPCITLLTNLANGGKPVADEGMEERELQDPPRE